VLGADAVLVHAAPPPPDDGPTGAAALEALLESRLPPVGIEQVFEAEPEAITGLIRERAKVPREERIRLARARRAAVAGGEVDDKASVLHGNVGRRSGGVGGVEKWGPSGEVVDELKDVIWKVGERRRRMAESQARAAGGGEAPVGVLVAPEP